MSIFKAFKQSRITNEERNWGLAQYDTLCGLIECGKWEYSISKLKKEKETYSFFTWLEVHPVLAMLFFICLVPLGFIPAIFYGIMLMIMKPAREQYEIHINKLKNGHPLEGRTTATSSNGADEIAKFHQLLKSGAISEHEYIEEKTKILKKAA